MQELDKGLNLAQRGPEAEAALAAFRRQIEVWEIVMPPVEPLVLDFGLGQLQRVGLIEYWIANESEAGYCGKYLFVFDGQQCPAHCHRTKHETFFVVRGCLNVTLDGRPITLRPGQVLPVPPGCVHSFQGAGNTLLLELSMPCEVRDNCFEDPRIMDWLQRLSL
jgi:D-lyxose ketol-isomerase